MASKDPYILIGLYESLYKEKYKRPPKLNKFKMKWAMIDVVESIGLDRAKELLIYYFSVGKVGHPLEFFLYNFDKLDGIKAEIDKDMVKREALRKSTKIIMEGNE